MRLNVPLVSYSKVLKSNQKTRVPTSAAEQCERHQMLAMANMLVIIGVSELLTVSVLELLFSFIIHMFVVPGGASWTCCRTWRLHKTDYKRRLAQSDGLAENGANPRDAAVDSTRLISGILQVPFEIFLLMASFTAPFITFPLIQACRISGGRVIIHGSAGEVASTLLQAS